MAAKLKKVKKLFEELGNVWLNKEELDSLNAGYCFPDFDTCTEEEKTRIREEDSSAFITLSSRELGVIGLTLGKLGSEDRREEHIAYVPKGHYAYMIELDAGTSKASVSFIDDISDAQTTFLRNSFDFLSEGMYEIISIYKKDVDTLTDLFSRIRDTALPQFGNAKTWLKHNPDIFGLVMKAERVNRRYDIEEKHKNCDRTAIETIRTEELDDIAKEVAEKLRRAV